MGRCGRGISARHDRADIRSGLAAFHARGNDKMNNITIMKRKIASMTQKDCEILLMLLKLDLNTNYGLSVRKTKKQMRMNFIFTQRVRRRMKELSK
ncbi:hypothetical protein HUU40_00210 [candidate division KSB1 bacterium]|nr:hypothetical protein [candidate division KSB1 bacterium]